MTGHRFTLHRMFAILGKELIQMRRDRMTLGLLFGIPLMQLFIFGYAINMVPRHLATVVSISDPGPTSDAIVAAIANSSYFEVVKATNSPAEARKMLAEGSASFAVEIPVNFSRDLVRGAKPNLLVEADATDPAAGSYALAAIPTIATTALRDDLVGPLAGRAAQPSAFGVVVHSLYNPEANTQYNIVPGLLGIILTMTMVLATSIALTRERERGTYENLLAMPTRPVEIMVGKILPNIFVGAFQCALILLIAKFVFHVPMIGSFGLLAATATVFITALLAVGYTISTIAANQMQAMQMTFFFFLPSIMLSGFIFPFRGMPDWAQWLGECLPITHFLRIVRGILLKGNGPAEVWGDVWPMILFLFIAGTVAIKRFRRTLD
ncbi:MAG TPA: ABC transporter permease [Rhizomicrobium sp.]|nr:ABC transporter permease [Rhizomicrobium sp.]